MKTGIISQARMTSTRLPEKVLKLIGGNPMLKYHTDRLKESGMPVFIATTVNKTDDPIVAFCQEENIPFYRGSENNVLSRYYECAKENKLDVIVRVTSDCPLVDGELIRKAWEDYKDSFKKYSYISNGVNRTYPRGFDFEIFSFAYLEEAYKKATLEMDLEHVTPYIHQNRNGNTDFFHYINKEDKSSYRITVDTSDDFELIRQLIENHQAHHLHAHRIIKLLDKHPSLALINRHIEQKKLQ